MALQEGYSPPQTERGGIVNSLMTSLKTPRSGDEATSTSQIRDSPRDGSLTLLKSMTNALSRIKSKDKPDSSPMSAMEELQELARMANMAATQSGGSSSDAAQLERGLEDQMSRHQQQLDQLYTPDGHPVDSPLGRLKTQEIQKLSQELNVMRDQQARIRSARGFTPSPGGHLAPNLGVASSQQV